MAIMTKIRKNDAEKIIAEGGHVSSDNQKPNVRRLCIYMPVDLIHKIDQVKHERYGISRNAWIVEAIQKQLTG